MKTAHLIVVLLGALLMNSRAWAASATTRGDEAPQARAYLQWFTGVLDQIQADMPAISAAAQAAATPLLAGKKAGVRGAPGLHDELSNRAGGFVIFSSVGRGEAGDLIIYNLGLPMRAVPDTKAALEKELADAAELLAQGSVVIGIASAAQLRELGLLEKARKACTALLDSHAPAGEGLVEDANAKAIIPTRTIADAALAWAWSAELLAACTRQGKTPALFESIVTDSKRQRYDRFKNTRFHEPADGLTVPPIPAGKLGREYLQNLQAIFRDIGTTSWPALTQASRRIANTLLDGGKVFVYANGHMPPYHHAGQLAADPRLYTPLAPDDKTKPQPGPDDLILAIGYCLPPGDNFWGNPAVYGDAGRGVIWVISGYMTKPADLGPRDMLVDQQWPPGDALVKVPGYDVRFGPPSGITAEAILWMITAQVRDEMNQAPARLKK